MIALGSLALFTMERLRCVLLALATIVLVKITAIALIAPMLGPAPMPGVSTAATPGFASD